MPVELDLSRINLALRDLARERYSKGDSVGLLCLLGNTGILSFVMENVAALSQKGMLESCIVSAVNGTRTNNRVYELGSFQWLFGHANKEKLRAAGDKLPQTGPITIYRGVAGSGTARRIDGISWTLSLDLACWFALRFNLRHPAVYKATIRASQVAFYTNERKEQEVVTLKATPERLKISIEEMKERNESVKKRRAAELETWLKEVKTKRRLKKGK